MIYEYKCEQCNKEALITKPMMQASKIEKCNKCNEEMKRIYSSSSIKTNDGIKK